MLRRNPLGYILSFLLPMGILLLTFFLLGIYPFGDTSVMLYDMHVQYAEFFGWLHNVFSGASGLTYSVAKGLGGGMLATFAYYLSSPFNLLVLFFDAAQTPQLFSWLYLLKIPAAGLTCYVYLRLSLREASTCDVESPVGGSSIIATCDLPFVLLATAYALSSYTVGYASNIMWLDGVIMLPLVCLGVYRLVHAGRCVLLYVAVTCSILFNWYTAYMICFFSIFYFIYEIFCRRLSESRGFAKSATGRYILTMLCAVLSSMFLLLPNILALSAGKGAHSGLSAVFGSGLISMNPLRMMDYACIGTLPGIAMPNTTPAMVVSACVLVMAAAYFFNVGISQRMRLCGGLLLLFIVLSYVLTPLENIWSGFVYAASYFNRNGFILMFFLVSLAAESLLGLKGIGSHQRLLAISLGAALTILLLAIAVLLQWLKTGDICPSTRYVVLEFILLALFAAIVIGWSNCSGKTSSWLLALLFAVFIGEQCCSVNSLLSLCFMSVSDYSSYITTMETLYQPLRTRDGFTRVGQAGFNSIGEQSYVTNDESLIFGVSNFNHYSSTQENNTQDLLAHLGYSKATPFGTYYNAPLMVMDSLLGVTDIVYDETPPGTTLEDSSGLPYPDYHLYSNDEAMPLGYGVDEAGDIEWIDDPYVNQELLLQTMTGESAAGFYSDESATEVVDSTAADAGSRSWLVHVTQDGPLYVYTSRINTTAANGGGLECRLYLNGVYNQRIGGQDSCNIAYLGTYSAGDDVRLTITPIDSAQVVVDEQGHKSTAQDIFYSAPSDSMLELKTLDVDMFRRCRQTLDTTGFDLSSYSDGALDATFTAREDETLLLTVPYDKGWEVMLDGKRVDAREMYDGLTGIDVSGGTHEVRMRYVSPGLRGGLLLSMVGIAVFVIWQRAGSVKRRRKPCEDSG